MSDRVSYIQSASRLVDITARGDFLGLCDKKSSYKPCNRSVIYIREFIKGNGGRLPDH